MLALTRKCGERIVIGDDITITVVDIKGDSIRVSIDAPKHVKIYRGELYDAIVDENRLSAELPNLDQVNLLQKLHRSK